MSQVYIISSGGVIKMVIGIFGASCTGKTSIAKEIAKRTNAKVFTGKDYMRGAKSEVEAKSNLSIYFVPTRQEMII